MDYTLLTKDPLHLGAVHELVAHESCGAVSYFVGTTRDNFESKKVLSLEYEAYEPMALKVMQSICADLRARWPDIVNIAIHHRLGLVKVREASVIVAISSPHRQTSLDATAQAIEVLKQKVPIWKKEKYCDNEAAWKENKECAWLSKDQGSEKKIPLKKTLDFSACAVGSTKQVENDLVQISAPEAEIERRIQSFVKKKREEIDICNSLDFIGTKPNLEESLEDQNTCARTDSILIKQEKSKGHLRVRRAARNDGGPQTRPDYLQALDKHMANSKDNKTLHIKKENTILNERLNNVETYLELSNSSTRSTHERLKAIENRILFLETISPEYKHFLSDNSTTKQTNELSGRTFNTCSRKTFTIAELDAIINEYEK